VPEAEPNALVVEPKPPVVPDPPWPNRVEPVFEPKAGLFAWLPKLKADPVVLVVPNPVPVLLPNPPVLDPKPVVVELLPKRLGAEEVLVLPKAGLFWPKRDVAVLLVEPKPPVVENEVSLCDFCARFCE
jgi:hypothetical protein